MAKKQGPHTAGQNDSSDISLALDAFLRKSRFKTCGLVIDLRDADALGALRRTIKSADALGAIRTSKAAGLPYVVLAGHLARKRGGVVAVGTDALRLPLAMEIVCERISAAGETMSLWIVQPAEPVRGEVQTCLAELSAVEGCA